MTDLIISLSTHLCSAGVPSLKFHGDGTFRLQKGPGKYFEWGNRCESGDYWSASINPQNYEGGVSSYLSSVWPVACCQRFVIRATILYLYSLVLFCRCFPYECLVLRIVPPGPVESDSLALSSTALLVDFGIFCHARVWSYVSRGRPQSPEHTHWLGTLMDCVCSWRCFFCPENLCSLVYSWISPIYNHFQVQHQAPLFSTLSCRMCDMHPPTM